MLSLLSEAFLLGLSMGPACLGYCAPVLVPLAASERQSGWRGAVRTVALFLLGRLAGYSLVGIIIGLAGATLLKNLGPAAWSTIRIVMGILLIVSGLLSNSEGRKSCAAGSVTARLPWVSAAAGLLTGLNLCPPFGAAIAGAATAASVRKSLFYFWAFFAGTAIYFVPFSLIGPLTRIEALRHVARVCLFLSGAWLLLEGLGMALWAR